MSHEDDIARLKQQAEHVVKIELTPEQQALVKEQSGGKLDTHTLHLRPNLNLREFLALPETTQDAVGLSIAPPPAGTAWA
jgi:hypothetical protein